MSASDVTHHDEATGLFTRNATGLVRQVKQSDNLGLAFLAGTPTIALAYGIFFALGGFPKGNIFLAALLGLPIALVFAYTFGLLSAAIPRDGGDYVLVTRILTPTAGLISSWCMMMAVALSVAFGAKLFVTVAVGPGLQVLGLVGHSKTLFNWGSTVNTSHAWQFGLGALLLVCTGIMMSLGTRRVRKLFVLFLAVPLGGLLISVLVALFTPQHAFVADFNAFARPYTHLRDSYDAIIKSGVKLGIPVNPPFSFSASIPIIGIMSTFGIYAFTGSYVAGELRQAGTMKTAHRMALGAFLAIAGLTVSCAVFFHSWGRGFLAAVFGGALPTKLGTLPAYFFLTSAQIGSTLVAVILVVAFLFMWPNYIALNAVMTTRTLFAYAFDGILPRKVADIDERTNSPLVANIVTTILYLLTFAWAILVSHSLAQIIVYASLIELIAMALVGLAAVVLPYRRPEFYRASVTARRVLGIPLVSALGSLAIACVVFLWWLYFKYSWFGLANRGQFAGWVGGTFAGGLLMYWVAKRIRAREGIDLTMVYAEIPPE